MVCTSKNWLGRAVPDVIRGHLNLGDGQLEYTVAGMHPRPHDVGSASGEDGQVLAAVAVTRTAEALLVVYAEGHLVLQSEAEQVRVGEFTLNEDTVGLICWKDDVARKFNYDPSTGKCINANGETGLNRWPIEMIRERSDAHCADLSGMVLGEENYSYPVLKWDFIGADFGDAELMFAKLMDVRLDGADMKELHMGYAHVVGQGDAYTEFPQDCEVSEDYAARCAK